MAYICDIEIKQQIPTDMATSTDNNDLADKYYFVCCWTCKNCIYELEKCAHECMLTGSQIEDVHILTECKEWIQE